MFEDRSKKRAHRPLLPMLASREYDLGTAKTGAAIDGRAGFISQLSRARPATAII
jgi:hypothetical protein